MMMDEIGGGGGYLYGIEEVTIVGYKYSSLLPNSMCYDPKG